MTAFLFIWIAVSFIYWGIIALMMRDFYIHWDKTIFSKVDKK